MAVLWKPCEKQDFCASRVTARYSAWSAVAARRRADPFVNASIGPPYDSRTRSRRIGPPPRGLGGGRTGRQTAAPKRRERIQVCRPRLVPARHETTANRRECQNEGRARAYSEALERSIESRHPHGCPMQTERRGGQTAAPDLADIGKPLLSRARGRDDGRIDPPPSPGHGTGARRDPDGGDCLLDGASRPRLLEQRRFEPR